MISLNTLLFVTFLYAGGNYAEMNNDEITEEKAGDMFNCLCVICCDLQRVDELERIFDTCTPDLQNKALHWYGDCYGMGFQTPKEFFDKFYDTVCPNPIHKKRECFKELMMKFGNYYEGICGEELNAEECAAAERPIAEVKLVIHEYTAKGHCYNPEDMANKTAEEGPHRITGYKEDEIKNMDLGK